MPTKWRSESTLEWLSETVKMTFTSVRWTLAWSLSLLALLSADLTSASRVVLRDNGYEGVVVALEESLPPSLCQDVLHGLEVSNEISQFLPLKR